MGALALMLVCLHLASLFLPIVDSSSSFDISSTFVSCASSHGLASSSIILAASTNFEFALNNTIENLRFVESTQPKPLLITLPTSTHDVVTIVRCAAEANLLIRIRSGGHSYEGQSSTADAGFPFVIIDVQLLSSIRIIGPSTSPQVHVQSGATLGQTYYAISQLAPSFALTAGSCPTVGVGGYFSGGGYGLLGRIYGLAADHITDVTLVTSTGSILTRSNMSEDLFWSLRGGGGGSFGLVIDWTIQLKPAPEVVTVFRYSVTGHDNVSDAIIAWQSYAPLAQEEMYLSCFLSTSIDPDTGESVVHASLSLMSLMNASATYSVLSQQFPYLNNSITNFTSSSLTEMSYPSSLLHFAVGLPHGATLPDLRDRVQIHKSYFVAKSDYVLPIQPWEEEAVDTLLQGMMRAPHAWIMLDPYGGAMAQVSPQALPFPHRRALFAVQYQSVWEDPSDEPDRRQGLRAIYSSMSQYVSSQPRQAYVNYPDFDLGMAWNGTATIIESEGWMLPYFGAENMERLIRTKMEIDPENVFRNAQSVQILQDDSEQDDSEHVKKQMDSEKLRPENFLRPSQEEYAKESL